MPRVLLTAFGPYQAWQENASWLTLIELTKTLPETPEVTTRRYEVDLAKCREQLQSDLSHGFDYAIHLGQAPGSTAIQLENLAVNVFDDAKVRHKIDEDGPPAFETTLPVTEWAERLRESGIPAVVSDHAGTYLCNAIYYLSHQLSSGNGRGTQSLFIHVPITERQATQHTDLPSLSPHCGAQALMRIFNWILESEESLA